MTDRPASSVGLHVAVDPLMRIADIQRVDAAGSSTFSVQDFVTVTSCTHHSTACWYVPV